MTAAELARHNLARLLRESGRDPTDVAIRAWPMPERKTARLWSADVEVRRKKLSRYLDGTVALTWGSIDVLARALGVARVEFLREVES